MFIKAKKLVKLVLSPQPDISTPAGRSQDRYRRAARSALAAAAARVVNISTGLIVVPLTLGYLGQERFGLWMAITSFVSFLVFTDLGLGVGLQNALAKLYGQDDHENPGGYIASGLAAMLLMFAALTAVAIFILPLLPLRDLLNVQGAVATEELLPTAQAVLIAFGFGLPAGLIQRIYNAYQRGYWGSLQLACGNILGLLGVLLCVHLRLGLPILAGTLVGARFSVMLLGSIVLFVRTPSLRPHPRLITVGKIRTITGVGLMALGARIPTVLRHSVPLVLIANRFGVAAVTPFAVTLRLIFTGVGLFTMFLSPLWPAYSEAAARGDWSWIRRTLKRTVRLWSLVCIPSFVFLVFAGQWIIRIWTRESEAVPVFSLLLACCVWGCVRTWSTTQSIVLDGLSRFKGQTIYGSISSLSALLIAWAVAPYSSVSCFIWIIVLVACIFRGVAMNIELSMVLRRHC